MALLLDKILVIDVESTCWEDDPPSGMISEIIEIGVCLLDIYSGEISDNIEILVKPEISVISKFCTGLTTITPEMIEIQGVVFKEACRCLKKEFLTVSDTITANVSSPVVITAVDVKQ